MATSIIFYCDSRLVLCISKSVRNDREAHNKTTMILRLEQLSLEICMYSTKFNAMKWKFWLLGIQRTKGWMKREIWFLFCNQLIFNSIINPIPRRLKHILNVKLFIAYAPLLVSAQFALAIIISEYFNGQGYFRKLQIHTFVF